MGPGAEIENIGLEGSSVLAGAAGGAGLLGRRADFRGGESKRDGGRGVADVSTGLPSSFAVFFVAVDFIEADLASPPLTVFVGAGVWVPSIVRLPTFSGATRDEPGAVGSDICEFPWLLGALGTSGMVGPALLSMRDMMVFGSAMELERAMDPLGRVFLAVPADLTVLADLTVFADLTESVLLTVPERVRAPLEEAGAALAFWFPGVGVAAPDRGVSRPVIVLWLDARFMSARTGF